jgi:hypothetical protein
MKNRKIEVLGIPVTIKTIEEDDYISLTDIAKSESGQAAKDLIRNWLKNQRTLLFLTAWEKVHNPNFKSDQMDAFRLEATRPRFNPSIKSYVEMTGAIGVLSKAGRYGAGTFAHIEIALSFAYWLEPEFQVYFLKEFNRMKKEETALINNTKKWAFEKLLRGAEEFQTVAKIGLEIDKTEEE